MGRPATEYDTIKRNLEDHFQSLLRGQHQRQFAFDPDQYAIDVIATEKPLVQRLRLHMDHLRKLFPLSAYAST